jgi:hypothetical protein
MSSKVIGFYKTVFFIISQTSFLTNLFTRHGHRGKTQIQIVAMIRNLKINFTLKMVHNRFLYCTICHITLLTLLTQTICL